MHDSLNCMTPDEVVAAWAEIADGCDPTEADEQATELLRNAAEHDDAVEGALEHIRLVAQTEGVSLEDMGYEFCLERRVWRRGIEAVLQARVLQQILRWSVLVPSDRQALRRVVVRHTFYARLDYAPPSLRTNRHIKFIVVPFAYQELLLLAAASLSQMILSTGVNDPWSCLDHVPEQSSEAPPAFRKLVARVVTSAAFDTQTASKDPVSSLAQLDGWFSCIDILEDTTSLEAALIYSAQDFALSHELGHCLSPAGARTYLDAEQEADVSGLRLFAASWGWRDEILNECPLGQGARILLGPIFFFFTAALLFDIRRLLSERIGHNFNIDTEFLTDAQDKLHLSDLSLRWKNVHRHLSFYVEEVKQLAGPFDIDDERKLNNFICALQKLSSGVGSWLAGLSDDNLISAIRLVFPSIAPLPAV